MPNENIGGISVSISVGLQDLEAQLSQAQQMSQQAGQAMASAFNGASSAAGGLSGSLQEVGSSLTPLLGLGLALAPISAGIFEAGKSALEAAGKFEQWQVSFTQLLGSATAAKSMLEDLVNFATRTPFEIPDVVSNAQRLMAFGFAARDVIPILTSLGDAVSGLGRGAQSLNSLVLAFGEMEAKGVVNLRQLNMLTNQGIPAIELLAKAYDVSVTQMSDAISKKLVPSAEAIPVLLAGITEKFGGMMDKQSQTFLGMLSNLSDAAMKTFAAIGNTMLPVAKDLEQSGFMILNSLTDVAKAFESLPVPVQEAAIALAAIGAAAAPIALALGAVGLAITSIGAAMPVLIPLAGILGGIAAGIALIHFSDVDTEALHFFQTLHEGFSGLKDLVSGATDAIRSFAKELSVLSDLVPGVNLAWDAIQKFAGSIDTVKQAILILMPPLDMARVAFTTLAIATEYLSGNYKSMDAAQKAVNASLEIATRATVDATGPATALGGAIGGVTDHLVLGTKAHADHAGAVSVTAKTYKDWNDEVSAALGLGPKNITVTSDLTAAFKFLGDQIAAADELWKHYIVDADQAMGIMEKGAGTVGGFTVSMENGVEMIKGSAEALQTTSGKILDFTTVEGQATSATDGLTSSLGSQSSSFDHLGVTAEAASKKTRAALTGMEDGFAATTGKVDALSVGVAFLAMQLSGLTAFAGSGINYATGGSDLQHQLYLAQQAAGNPIYQPTSFTVSTGGSTKGDIFGSQSDLATALQNASKGVSDLTTTTKSLGDAAGVSANVIRDLNSSINQLSTGNTSFTNSVDGLSGVYTTTNQQIDYASLSSAQLGNVLDTLNSELLKAGVVVDTTGLSAVDAAQKLQNTVDGMNASSAAAKDFAQQATATAQAVSSAASVIQSAGESLGGTQLGTTYTINGQKVDSNDPQLAQLKSLFDSYGNLKPGPSGSSGEGPTSTFQFSPGETAGNSGALFSYNGQPITEAMYQTLLHNMNANGGSTAMSADILPAMQNNGTPSGFTGTSGTVYKNDGSMQPITVNMSYPQFNNQQQADQIMKQIVTQLRTVAGQKL